MTADGQVFRMVIEEVVTITGRPGAYLGGTIESGVVQVGDELGLLDGGQLAGQVRCAGLGSLDSSRDAGRCLAAVHVASLGPGGVCEGQVLAGTEVRRPGEAALPHSISAPLFRQQTAEAAAFARHYAPLLIRQAGHVLPDADTGHEA